MGFLLGFALLPLLAISGAIAAIFMVAPVVRGALRGKNALDQFAAADTDARRYAAAQQSFGERANLLDLIKAQQEFLEIDEENGVPVYRYTKIKNGVPIPENERRVLTDILEIEDLKTKLEKVGAVNDFRDYKNIQIGIDKADENMGIRVLRQKSDTKLQLQ
jgi:hypothetical protein